MAGRFALQIDDAGYSDNQIAGKACPALTLSGACGAAYGLLRFLTGRLASTPNGGGRDRTMVESRAIESRVIDSGMASANRGGNQRNLRSLRNLIAAATAVVGLLTMTATARPQASPEPSPQATKEAKHAKGAKHTKETKRRVIPVTIGKGETYTISGLEKGAKTDSKAGKNPNALSIQPQPSGDIVLLGTEGGSWKIDATLASGEKVTYEVKVKAEAPPINSLTPGTAPTAIGP